MFATDVVSGSVLHAGRHSRHLSSNQGDGVHCCRSMKSSATRFHRYVTDSSQTRAVEQRSILCDAVAPAARDELVVIGVSLGDRCKCVDRSDGTVDERGRILDNVADGIGGVPQEPGLQVVQSADAWISTSDRDVAPAQRLHRRGDRSRTSPGPGATGDGFGSRRGVVARFSRNFHTGTFRAESTIQRDETV